MDYKLIMLAAVAVAVIGITSAEDKKIKCYECLSTATECAADPLKLVDKKVTEKECDAGIKYCTKQEAKSGDKVTVARGCGSAECKTDKDKGLYCCEGDKCNGVSGLTGGVTTVLLCIGAVFLKSLY